jgi:hypothetical protein
MAPPPEDDKEKPGKPSNKHNGKPRNNDHIEHPTQMSSEENESGKAISAMHAGTLSGRVRKGRNDRGLV